MFWVPCICIINLYNHQHIAEFGTNTTLCVLSKYCIKHSTCILWFDVTSFNIQVLPEAGGHILRTSSMDQNKDKRMSYAACGIAYDHVRYSYATN